MNGRLILIASAAVIGAGLARVDTTLLTQNFEGNWPPSGWAVHASAQPDTCVWHRARDLGDTCWPDNSSHFAAFENHPEVDLTDTLISPIIDCSGHGNIALRCSTFVLGSLGMYTARIIGSIDGGASYPFDVRVYEGLNSSFGPGLETLSLNWASGKPQVRLAWLFDGNTVQFGPWWAIDNLSITGGPIVHDVGTDSILTPKGLVDSGSVVNPTAVVRNHGTVGESLMVRMRIGANYNQVLTVRSLMAGAESTVVFPYWQVDHVGVFPVTCSTELAGDANHDNDAVRDSVRVVSGRIVIVLIRSPADSVDLGDTIHPQLRVRNRGPDEMTFGIYLSINPGNYAASETVSIAGAQELNVVFGHPWIPTERIRYYLRCSTDVYGSVTETMTIYVKGCGLSERPSPGGILPPSANSRELSLGPASPNPLLVCTRIRYGIPMAGLVALRIYTPTGILVRELGGGIMAPGYHEAAWDGRDRDGRPCGKGIYLCRLEAGGQSLTAKLVKLE